MQTVKDILNGKGRVVFSVTPEKSVYEALELMEEKNVGVVLVMGPDAALLGVFSERDYARKIVLKGKKSHTTTVGEVMTKKVLCVDIAQSVENCMALMTEKRIRHLPVLEDERVTGIISIGDIVKANMAEKDLLIDQLEHYIAGSI